MDVQEIADRLEIDQLMVRYVEAIDGKNWELLDTVFTADAVLDFSSSGGADARGDYPTMRAWLEHALAVFAMTQHLIGKSAVDYRGDTAHCRTVFHNPMTVPVNEVGVYDPAGSGRHILTVGGWYRDTCVRTEGGWRISEKVEEQAFMEGGFPPLE